MGNSVACRLSMFKSRVNSVTGKMEWVVTEKDFDSLETDFAEEFSRYDHYSDVRLHEHIYIYTDLNMVICFMTLNE